MSWEQSIIGATSHLRPRARRIKRHTKNKNTLRQCVRGVFSAKGPDSSFGGVPVVNCPDDDHTEEEVQLKVQVEDEEEIGETHGEEQGKEQRVKERPTAQRG